MIDEDAQEDSDDLRAEWLTNPVTAAVRIAQWRARRQLVLELIGAARSSGDPAISAIAARVVASDGMVKLLGGKTLEEEGK